MKTARLLLVLMGALVASPQAGCKKDVDLSRLQGTWREVDSGKKIDFDDQGEGFGPYGALGAGCGSPPDGTYKPPFKSSFPCDEGACFLASKSPTCGKPCAGTTCDDGYRCITDFASKEQSCLAVYPAPLHTLHTRVNAFGEFVFVYGDDSTDANLPLCGPCTLDEEGGHLSCKQVTANGGFSTCEFDRVGGPAPRPGDDASLSDTAETLH